MAAVDSSKSGADGRLFGPIVRQNRVFDMVPSEIRHRVDPGDVPAEKAARRLHLTLDRFNELLPKLTARGFPAADPDTGYYDLDAIDMWRKRRNPKIFGLTETPPDGQPAAEPKPAGMGDRFRETKERKRHDRVA